MIEAKLGFGAAIRMGDGADPEVFTTIAGLKDFDFNEAAELVEVTNHSSPAASATPGAPPRREYINGPVDSEDIVLPMVYSYSDATQDTATGLQSKKFQKVNFELIEPGSTKKFAFSALILKLGKSFPVEDAMMMEVTLKPTGDIVEGDV